MVRRSAEPVLLGTAEITRHYHPQPYATLVLDGGYEEAGDQGRFQVAAGDFLIHPAFSAHRDIVRGPRTWVLDLPLPLDGRAWPAVGRIADPELVIRVAARDCLEARSLAIHGFVAADKQTGDPADRLADALTDNPSLPIGEWAAAQGLSREWLSRRFSRLYGVDAALFRAEARTRRAWRLIVSTQEPLAGIAAESGFADQSHMTRAVRRLTGRSPRFWRVTSVQEGPRAAL